MSKWSVDDVPDLTGRVFAITGANSGIGFEAARVLSRRGATTILAGRNREKVEAARAAISAESKGAEVRTVRLDLASLASVREAAAELGDAGVDVLINNAGVMALPRSETEDGFEMQLGVNHLGHFALTAALWPRIRERVITVSSVAHKFGKIDFDDLMRERRYQKWLAYGQSKLANVLFALELHRRAQTAGSAVRSLLCHPGYASTNLQGVGPQMAKSAFMGGLMSFSNAVFAQSAEAGAWPTIMAATAELPSGSFTGPSGPTEWRGRPRLVHPSQSGQDEVVARRLWEASEALTDVAFDV
jgi:NAD(P)-dependent dehydrogenase (short-subunit alcohol dehydrogenase family)